MARSVSMFLHNCAYVGKSLAIYDAKQCGNILFNGFQTNISEEDKKSEDYVPITTQHFRPFNRWQKINYNQIRDLSTQDLYLNQDTKNLRIKCSILFFATCIFQPIGLSLNCINRISKITTLSHFWHRSKKPSYNLKGRIHEMKNDVLRVVTAPVILGAFLTASLYGLFRPYDGRKIYATLERASYGQSYKKFPSNKPDKFMNFFLAPCFQPMAKHHRFGGDIQDKYAW
ncbi:MAG: hypothetical protein WCP39_03325 [Chlamydiota bacterium]